MPFTHLGESAKNRELQVLYELYEREMTSEELNRQFGPIFAAALESVLQDLVGYGLIRKITSKGLVSIGYSMTEAGKETVIWYKNQEEYLI